MYKPDKLFPLSVPDAPVEAWRKALLDAADVIRARGWCQGSLSNRQGQVCVLGAVIGVRPTKLDTARFDAAGRFIQFIGGGIGKWNDAPERTADEVISALEACARS